MDIIKDANILSDLQATCFILHICHSQSEPWDLFIVLPHQFICRVCMKMFCLSVAIVNISLFMKYILTRKRVIKKCLNLVWPIWWDHGNEPHFVMKQVISKVTMKSPLFALVYGGEHGGTGKWKRKNNLMICECTFLEICFVLLIKKWHW